VRGRAFVRASIAAAVVAAIVALPHVIAGAPVLSGLVEYGTRWRASPIAFAVLEAPFARAFEARAARGEYAHVHVSARGVVLENAGARIVGVGEPGDGARKVLVDAGFLARLIAGALVGAALVVLARSRSSPTVRAAAALACAWLLAPALHPWYFLWLVPFAALLRSRGLWALGASAPALYQPVFAYATTGEWHEALWPRVVVLAAAALGFAWDAREARPRRAQTEVTRGRPWGRASSGG
jgi:hypothetical protein